MEEPKNAKLFLALKSRYALHNTDRLVEFILDDQKTSFDFITEIIPQIEEENKKGEWLCYWIYFEKFINHNCAQLSMILYICD